MIVTIKDKENFWKDLVLISDDGKDMLYRDENGRPAGIRFNFPVCGDFCPHIDQRVIDLINTIFDLKSSNEIFFTTFHEPLFESSNKGFAEKLGIMLITQGHFGPERDLPYHFIMKPIIFTSEGLYYDYSAYFDCKKIANDKIVGYVKPKNCQFIKWEMFVEYDWDINSERILFTHKKDESSTVKYPYGVRPCAYRHYRASDTNPDNNGICDATSTGNFGIDEKTLSPKVFKDLVEYFLEKSGLSKTTADDLVVATQDPAVLAKRFAPENRKVIIVYSDTGLPPTTDLPVFKVSEVKDKFQFPPSHPVPNTAYAMAEMFPNNYWTINEFHLKQKQLKQFAFIELCATLGAKTVFVENIEIDNQTLDVHGNVQKMLTSVDVGFSMKRNTESGELIAFSFGEANKEIKPEYNSPWIATEPSWLSMNEMRRKFHLQDCQVEYNYSDDMGINANLELQLAKIAGIKIDANACKMRKVKLNFRVEFW